MNIAAYPKYESYKDSGIDWIGQIPTCWNVRRGKWLFKKMERSVRTEDHIVTCFRDGVVTLRENRRIEGFTNALKEHGYQGIRKGLRVRAPSLPQGILASLCRDRATCGTTCGQFAPQPTP